MKKTGWFTIAVSSILPALIAIVVGSERQGNKTKSPTRDACPETRKSKLGKWLKPFYYIATIVIAVVAVAGLLFNISSTRETLEMLHSAAVRAEKLRQPYFQLSDVTANNRYTTFTLKNLGVYPSQSLEGIYAYASQDGVLGVFRFSFGNEIPNGGEERVQKNHSSVGGNYLVVGLKYAVKDEWFSQSPPVFRRAGQEDPTPVTVAARRQLLARNEALRDTLAAFGVKLE